MFRELCFNSEPKQILHSLQTLLTDYPTTLFCRKEITFPIITNYEHLQRVSKKRMRSRPVNRQDNLPSLRANSRPASRVNALTVPDNSQISTPCPPDDYSLQPPIIDNWREWNLHHIHV